MLQNLETFWIYDVVSIGEDARYQACIIRRISTTGVTVQASDGLHVLNGKMQGILVRRGFKTYEDQPPIVPPKPRQPVVYQTVPLDNLSAALKACIQT